MQDPKSLRHVLHEYSTQPDYVFRLLSIFVNLPLDGGREERQERARVCLLERISRSFNSLTSGSLVCVIQCLRETSLTIIKSSSDSDSE